MRYKDTALLLKTKLNCHLKQRRITTITEGEGDMKTIRTIIIRHILTVLACPLAAVVMGCASGDKDREEAEAAALAFANAYFNYDFDEAAKFCTEDSRRWLAFAASNVYGADVEVLRNMDTGATADVTDVDFSDGDSTAVATVEVANFMQRDTIGKAGRVIDEAEFALTLVRSDGRWKVRMASLPRSGR